MSLRCNKCSMPLIQGLTQHGSGNWCDRCRCRTVPVKLGKPINLDNNSNITYTSTKKDYQAVDKPIHSDMKPVKPLLVSYKGEVLECFGRVSVVVGTTRNTDTIRIRRR